MSGCTIIPNINTSFFINGVYVIIYPPKQPEGSAKMFMGLNTYGLTRLVSVPPASGLDTTMSQSFVARYSQGKSSEFHQYTQDMQRKQGLEELAGGLSALITLPKPVVITINECGAENAFYTPQQHSITLCYELITHMADGINGEYAGTVSPQEIFASISGGTMFILMHEVGHALIQELDLPVLGREEDAADQIGAYFLLHTSSRAATAGLSGALWFFRDNTLLYSQEHFSDEHSLGPQRQANLACWAFGKDPSQYAYLLERGFLTQQRAERCGREYQQLESTIHKLLGKNLSL
jgi:hypothetical protein